MRNKTKTLDYAKGLIFPEGYVDVWRCGHVVLMDYVFKAKRRKKDGAYQG